MLDTYPKEIPDKYNKEIWAYLDDSDILEIELNRYQISTYGRLYDNKTGKIYPTDKITKPNNYTVHIFALRNGDHCCTTLHSITINKFKVFKAKDTTEIDHIDGVKYHNWIWNLEYVDHTENLKRAVDSGLYPVGEKHQNAIFTNDEIRQVCKLIQDGLSPAQIYNTLKDKIPNLSTHLIHDIKDNNHCSSISKEFDFSNVYKRCEYENANITLSENLVRDFCKGIEKYGYSCTPKEILINIGINFYELPEYQQNKYMNCISRLRRKLIFKDIVKDYNF